MENDYEKTVKRVGTSTILWNVILSVSKVIGGALARSSSLISDGIHSASDVLSTIVVMIGAHMSKKAPDKEHPFGHERMESVASFILAVLLAGTAIVLGYSGVLSIMAFAEGERKDTGGVMIWLALGFAVASIIVKAWMYFYTIHAAKKINSGGLKADAFHHLTDSLSSVGSVLGIIGLMAGGSWEIMDPIASIIIALFILKVSIDIARDAINQVVDKAAPNDFQEKIRDTAEEYPGIIRINSLKTRMFGNMYYVEMEIAVNDNLTIKEGHTIARGLHNKIESEHENIKHIMIHIDPASEIPEK